MFYSCRLFRSLDALFKVSIFVAANCHWRYVPLRISHSFETVFLRSWQYHLSLTCNGRRLGDCLLASSTTRVCTPRERHQFQIAGQAVGKPRHCCRSIEVQMLLTMMNDTILHSRPREMIEMIRRLWLSWHKLPPVHYIREEHTAHPIKRLFQGQYFVA